MPRRFIRKNNQASSFQSFGDLPEEAASEFSTEADPETLSLAARRVAEQVLSSSEHNSPEGSERDSDDEGSHVAASSIASPVSSTMATRARARMELAVVDREVDEVYGPVTTPDTRIEFEGPLRGDPVAPGHLILGDGDDVIQRGTLDGPGRTPPRARRGLLRERSPASQNAGPVRTRVHFDDEDRMMERVLAAILPRI